MKKHWGELEIIDGSVYLWAIWGASLAVKEREKKHERTRVEGWKRETLRPLFAQLEPPFCDLAVIFYDHLRLCAAVVVVVVSDRHLHNSGGARELYRRSMAERERPRDARTCFLYDNGQWFFQHRTRVFFPIAGGISIKKDASRNKQCSVEWQKKKKKKARIIRWPSFQSTE